MKRNKFYEMTSKEILVNSKYLKQDIDNTIDLVNEETGSVYSISFNNDRFILKYPNTHIPSLDKDLKSLLSYIGILENEMPQFKGTLQALDILCDIKTITDDYANNNLNTKTK